MKLILDQLLEKGFVEVDQSTEKSVFLVDPTSENSWVILAKVNPKIKIYFEHEGVIERFFPNLPETYFQLLDATNNQLDAILEQPQGFATYLQEQSHHYCVLANDNTLKQLLQRFRKPLALVEFSTSMLNTEQYQVLLRPENEKIQLRIAPQNEASLIHFKADGSFKMLKK
jgi:hypothetical protein